jgi:hypothetical protein
MGVEEGEGQDREVEYASVKYKLQRRALFCRHCRFGAPLTLEGGREREMLQTFGQIPRQQYHYVF